MGRQYTNGYEYAEALIAEHPGLTQEEFKAKGKEYAHAVYLHERWVSEFVRGWNAFSELHYSTPQHVQQTSM